MRVAIRIVLTFCHLLPGKAATGKHVPANNGMVVGVQDCERQLGEARQSEF